MTGKIIAISDLHLGQSGADGLGQYLTVLLFEPDDGPLPKEMIRSSNVPDDDAGPAQPSPAQPSPGRVSPHRTKEIPYRALRIA